MRIVQLTAVELTLRVARAPVGASEVPAGSNWGPFIRRCLKAAGIDFAAPWCVAYAQLMGKTALQKWWPLPVTAGCQYLAEWAEKKGVLYDTPKVGDMFLMWELVKSKEHPEGVWRFAHTGFIDEGPLVEGKWPTLEGNTSGEGSREGWIVAARHRGFGPKDRFFRWAELIPEDV